MLALLNNDVGRTLFVGSGKREKVWDRAENEMDHYANKKYGS